MADEISIPQEINDAASGPPPAEPPAFELSAAEKAMIDNANLPEDDRIPLIDIQELEDPGKGITMLYMSGGDPNFEYAWLNTRPEMLEKNKMAYGYEIVKQGDSVVTLVPPNSSGERKLGDLVLARIAKHRFDRISAIGRREAISRVRSASEGWKQEMANLGFKTDDSTRIQLKEGTG